MRLLLIPLFLFFVSSQIYGQQQPFRSLFDATGFLHNPAMTAPGKYLEWGAIHQEQWLGFEDAPRTSQVYLQVPFPSNSMSVGAAVSLDEVGPLQTSEVNLSYSYHLNLDGQQQLSLGVAGRFFQQRFNSTDFTGSSPTDPIYSLDFTPTIAYDFGFGIFYTTDKRMFGYYKSAFFSGLSINSLLPKSSSSDLILKPALHATALAGYRFSYDNGFLEPSIWVQYAQLGIIHASANLVYEAEEQYWVGTSLESDMTATFQSGFYLTDGLFREGFLRVGVQGSFNFGQLSALKGWGLEFLLGYRFYRD